MTLQDSSLDQRDPLNAEEDLRSAFAVLARAPAPIRPEYATRLRGALRDELAAQAVRRAQPPWWRWFASPARPAARTVREASLQRNGFGLRLAMTAMGAVLILALVTVLGTRLYPLQVGQQVASVSVATGEVQVVRLVRVWGDLGLTRRLTVSTARVARLQPGDEIVSSQDAEAEIVFTDGSKMVVGPGVQLTFEQLQARTASRPLAIAMRLERGEVQSQVEHLRADQDRFEVQTPNLVAQVRGTVFRVDVRSEGTRVATDTGVVRVNYGDQAVDVEAGRELEVLLGKPGLEAQVRLQAPKLTPELPPQAASVGEEGERMYFTNASEVPWLVQTLPGADLTFYVNDVAVANARADGKGLATLYFTAPAEGTYRITAVMQMAGDESLPAKTQVLVVDRTPPPLVLTSPTEPQVKTNEVTIVGYTEPGVGLELNGRPVTVDEKGAFEQKLSLVKGENELIYIASDRAGNSVRLRSVLVLE